MNRLLCRRASLRRALALCLSLGFMFGGFAAKAASASTTAVPGNELAALAMPTQVNRENLRAAAIARAAELINNIRDKLDACGENGMMALGATPASIPQRPPLLWNEQLATAAQAHASAMVAQQFFSHADPNGATVGDRVSRSGYRWRQVGENLAAGLTTVDEAVREWLFSSTHCEVMIGDRFTEFGIATVSSQDPNDLYGTYWALVVAQPR